MRRAVWTIALAAFGAVGCSSGFAARPPAPEALVEGDVKAGYVAYRDFLARWGTWEADSFHQVRWCPRLDQLRPSPSRFSPLAPLPPERAPSAAATGTFESDDADAWHEVTTRGGRWLSEEDDDQQRWCWIPGLRADGARIVIRGKTSNHAVPDSRESRGEKVLQGIGAVLGALGTGAAAIAGEVLPLREDHAASKQEDDPR
jgi:hypothetical protein